MNYIKLKIKFIITIRPTRLINPIKREYTQQIENKAHVLLRGKNTQQIKNKAHCHYKPNRTYRATMGINNPTNTRIRHTGGGDSSGMHESSPTK